MKDSTVIKLDDYRRKPLEPGGLYWRRARGLLSVRDLADQYRATRYRRHPGLLAALPEDRLEVQR